MKYWWIPLLLLAGCADSGQLDRGYVISQQKEEPQVVAPDDDDAND